MSSRTFVPLTLCLVVAAVSTAAADSQHQTCIQRSFGVPTRPGPPNWWDPVTAGGDPSLDDPRWNQASAQSFQFGSAESPLHVRTLWSNAGGTDALYVSFISDLAPNPSTTRDVFLGFRRAHPDTKGTVDPSDDEFGYIFQFHLGAAIAGQAQTLRYCGRYENGSHTECPYADNWWRLFRDVNGIATCGTDSNPGEQYVAWNGGAVTTPPIGWMDKLRFWQITAPGPLQNRWAIQARIPFATATDPAWLAGHAYAAGDKVSNNGVTYQCITAGTSAASGGPAGIATDITDNTAHWKYVPTAVDLGIEKGSTYWYEATEDPVGPGAVPYTSLGKFPTPNAAAGLTGVTKSICPNVSNPDFLVHEELGSTPAPGAPDPKCTNCKPEDFSALLAFGASPVSPAVCDGGLSVDPGGIGAFYNDSRTSFDDVLGAPVNALKSIQAPLANTMIVQVENKSSSPIDVPLLARFRLANWGTAPFSAGSTDLGAFDAIRGSENGICSGGGAPPCSGPFPIQPSLSPTNRNRRAITFKWTLDDNERCAYGRATGCEECTCDPTNGCDPLAPAGTKGTRPTGTTGCVKKHFPHECMYVELSAPNGGVTFVQQSAYNNMDFGPLSVLAREALVDARKLPTVPGQAFQDIYLMVMPRNMPVSVPPTTTTVQLVQESAITAATRIAQPYIDDLNRVPPDQIPALEKRFARAAIAIRVPENDERVRRIIAARRIMPDDDVRRVDGLLRLALVSTKGDGPSAQQTRDAVTTLGAEQAAEVVPTLDIYPFYRPGDRGPAYQPMTGFTLFLSHEATLAGMRYAIDGADKVRENVYHMRIPVGFARKIQVRAQAIVGNEAVLIPGQAKWPCSTCCSNQRCGLLAGLGNTVPGVLAGVFVAGRRRRRGTAKQAKAPVEPVKG